MSDHSSDVDVVDVLTTDHREATELITEILDGTEPDRRRDLADQLIAELVRHSVAEEMFVYPAVREHVPDGDAKVEHDTQEHKQLEALMKRLEHLDPSSADFTSTVLELRAVLADHVSDEETEQFPELRAHVPAEQLVALKGKVEAAKRIAPTRPHPAAPNDALFHKTLGAGVGLVDRLRDALSGRST